MRRESNVTLKAMKAWIKEDASIDWNTINLKTFHSYVDQSMEKFRTRGNLKRKPGSGGGGEISLRKAQQIRQLAINQRFKGSRRVAGQVGVSDRTVRRQLKKAGTKAYHRVRVQNLKPEHKVARER